MDEASMSTWFLKLLESHEVQIELRQSDSCALIWHPAVTQSGTPIFRLQGEWQFLVLLHYLHLSSGGYYLALALRPKHQL